MRIGHGYDSHRFGADRPVVLGGVTIESEQGLVGHSDADAVAHAVIDAILGAAGLGNVGSHFPASDETWKDADSMSLLSQSVEIIAAANYQVVNVDITVIAESLMIGPHATQMSTRLAEVIGIPSGNVSVKGKTNEKLGWIGAGEGIAVHAVALINSVEDQDLLHAKLAPDLPRL